MNGKVVDVNGSVVDDENFTVSSAAASDKRDLLVKDGFSSSLSDQPEVRPYDIEKDREQTRARIAFTLVLLLVAIIGLSFVTLVIPPLKFLADVKPLLDLIFAPVVALVGTAWGFYFGGKAT